MPLTPPRVPLVYLVQAIPGDYRTGDVVFSLISHSDKDGSFEPGAKGNVVCQSTFDPNTQLAAQFEGYGGTISMLLTSISRDPDPNNVGDDHCTARPPCVR